MPEAFAVVGVGFVCCVIYLFAKLQARNPELHLPSVRLEQLSQQRAWLEDRLRRAESENWSREMKQSIVAELEATLRKQADLVASSHTRG